MALIKSEKDELDRLTREIEECEKAIKYFDVLESDWITVDGINKAFRWWRRRRGRLMRARAHVLIAAAERIKAEGESHGTDS